MIFITGGKAQGKGEFALKLAGISLSEAVDGEKATSEQLKSCTVLLNIEKLFWRMFKGELSLTTEELLKNLNRQEVFITCTDVGGGIVPLTKEQRDYRDFVGKTGCRFAAEAEKVYRVFCGIASQIKGEGTDR